MTLGDIRGRCQQRFRDMSSLIVGLTTWNDHINAAYRHFIRAARWPFLVDSEDHLAHSTRLITPTIAALGNLEALYDSTNDRIIHMLPGLPWRFRLFLESQVPGDPAMYTVIGKDIYLIPPPAAPTDIRVYFYKDPVVLVNNGDVPEIPVRYHESLVAGAISKAHMDDGNIPASEQYAAEFEAIIQQAMKELLPGELVNPDGFAAAAANPVDETR